MRMFENGMSGFMRNCKNRMKTYSSFFQLGMILILAVVLTVGCGGNSGEKKEADNAEQSENLYPVTIDGIEVRVGETTMQTLLDAGLKVTVSEKTADNKINQYEIDPDTELEAYTYYTGASIFITDSIVAHVSFVTGEEAVKMGDAVVAYLEISFVNADTEELEKIALDGVPISEISREKAGEMFPDLTGDENMLLKYGKEYKYTFSFTLPDHMLSNISLTKQYDVDWTGKN